MTKLRRLAKPTHVGGHVTTLDDEIYRLRGEVSGLSRTIAAKDGELQKAEATIRTQDVELRRLRRRIAELESGPDQR